MKLATIFTSMFLVLALAIVGCDGGGDDGGKDTIIGGEDTTTPGDDTTTPGDDTAIDPACVATCALKCGMVGDCDCGGCDAGFTCVAATSTCAPEVVDCDAICTGKGCGTFDTCDCGECGADETCNATTGVCEVGVCQPACTGKQCGPDGCGGSCGLCPCVGCDPAATICNDGTGMCEAVAALTCKGINDCALECAPNDATCQQECMNQGSNEAQQQLSDLLQCFSDNGGQNCPPGDAQCQNDIIMEHCMDEYGACFPGGDKDCSEMFDCMEPCGSNQACLQDCYNQGTLDAQAQYQAIASCVTEQCPDPNDPSYQECFQAAQQGACAAIFSDCFNLG
ncbi:MAG: hypothetical protein ABIK09_10940 [Pseudomonadota bacterium]